jgi:4-hydroxythreonine-4-phosphate dehydrogenase
MQRPLAVTMGEPAGIGGEIVLAAWRALRMTGPVFLLVDDADRLGSTVPLARISAPEEAVAAFSQALPVLHRPLPALVTPGRPEPRNAPAVVAAIDLAVALAQAGRVAAVVTNPIQKSVLLAAGFAHPGHTEYLGELAGIGAPPVMLLACPGLRVVPVTIHEPLRVAITRLTPALIVTTARLTAAGLSQDFGIAAPRLAIAGLNPHAGEDGLLGTEERDIIIPAIAELRAEGINAFGPVPADALFTARARRGYDVAIGLYHDQALIPIKTLDVAGGVNVTLGLSIVRTSPDHGTALDIAGRGIADPSSLISAIRLAAEIAAHRARSRS